MPEVMRTADIALLSYVNSLLNSAGIGAFIADVHVSAVEGSIGAFPRRVVVAAEDFDEAVELLTDAGLERHLLTSQA
jgi:hypothetical protein